MNKNVFGDMVDVLPLQAPGAVTATGNGTGVDLLGYEGQLMVHQAIGTVTGTTPTLDGKLQESDDNSTFTDVTSGAFTQATAAGNQTKVFQKDQLKRYVRYVRTVGGTTPSFPISVVAVAMPKYPS